MISLNEKHPIEHIVGFIVVVIFHIVVIGLLIWFMHGPKDKPAEALPVQVQIVDVASSSSSASAQSAQPPAPDMIVPPTPDVDPPPINTEAPPKPPPPKVVKHTRKPAVSPPSQSASSAAASQGTASGERGDGQSNNAGQGKVDHSAGANPVNGVKVEYPPEMIEAGREGRVIVSCDIEVDGSTTNCHVVSATGGGAFKGSALRFVARAKYRPATNSQGKPVKEYGHRYTIDFRLDQ